ncbi:hypothetical protein [Streptomyces griseoaurantiacus]|uniref:hypothetical protein n=1 Tax=Streptomyces griseoaurantiacus TaxID=68213 RepID=UPI0036414167
MLRPGWPSHVFGARAGVVVSTSPRPVRASAVSTRPLRAARSGVCLGVVDEVERWT